MMRRGRRSWRQGEREGEKREAGERQRKKKRETDREKAYLLACRQQFFFRSWSCAPRAGRGSVFLFGVHEPEGQQFIP